MKKLLLATGCFLAALVPTLAAPPTITVQPSGLECFTSTSTAYFDNTNITLSVTATGTGLAYRWYQNLTARSDGSTISGSHSNTLTLKSGGSKDVANSLIGAWRCVVTNIEGSVTSSVAQVSMLPEITLPPLTNRTVFAGDRVGFSILGAYGSGSTRYFQWQASADGGTTFTNAFGLQTWGWHLTPPLNLWNSGIQYRCIVSELCGSVTSAPIVINVTNAVVPPSGLVAWWGAENNALDNVGTNYGTLNNISFTSGKVGQAFGFNGSNAFIFLPASPSLDIGQGNGFTIEAWVKSADLSTPRPIAQWTDGVDKGVSVWTGGTDCGPDTVFIDMVDDNLNSNPLCFYGDNLSEGTYSHLAITFDKINGNVEVYLNGYYITSYWVDSITAETSYDLYLGCSPAIGGGDASYWKGALDEISIYNRILGWDEILNIAQSSGKFRVALLEDPQLDSPAPFMKAPFVVTGAIEAEQFDKGGEGVAYHSQMDHRGNDYRRTGASIETCDDQGLGYCLTKTLPGDWFNYTFQVRTAGWYTVEARVAAYTPGNTFRMDFYTNGILSYQTANLAIPSTNWQCVADTQVWLAPGSNCFRLSMVATASGSHVGKFNYLAIYPTIVMSPFPTNTTLLTNLIEGAIGTNLSVALLNSSNIQRCVEGMAATGGTIEFPAGAFHLAQNPVPGYYGSSNPANWEPGVAANNFAVMWLTNNTRFKGNSATNTTLIAHNRMVVMFYGVGQTNIAFENLTLEGAPHTRFIVGQTNTVFEPGMVSKGDPNGPYLIFPVKTTNLNIHHCAFKNAPHHIFISTADQLLIQSNVFLNYTGELPNGAGVGAPAIADAYTRGQFGTGPAIQGGFNNYLVTSNYFNGSVSISTFYTNYADWTNVCDGLIFTKGGNGYLADNRIERYFIEATAFLAGPIAVVRNQFETFHQFHGSSCAMNPGENDSQSGVTHSKEDLSYCFIGNTVSGGQSGIRGNGAPATGTFQTPWSLNACGNTIDVDDGMLDVLSCAQLNCAGNTVEHAVYGVKLNASKGYPEAEILKNDFRGVTTAALERPNNKGGQLNVTVVKNHLGMGVGANAAHVKLWEDDAAAYYFIYNQYYDGAQNPTNALTTYPTNMPVHIW